MLLKNLHPVDNIVTSTQVVFPDSALKFFPPSKRPGAMPGPKLENLKGCY
ncbi:hypothetical protein DBT_2031 [Dissulfuribacter thermophilus]|uniref:Uncharacterized protein n=1 Tax=Dissulfuribacter thermophilus TaxID=1156395 RepID=A0A1B9F3J4_9BACT|nr:hypothetical protein [Dissulfuribacter thermophilus]OCC14490.1 hypothetical protein DBT_2031 [Dissulfuribacter thermophilus]